MKACIYNEKKGEKVKIFSKKEMIIFKPSSTPGYAKNPYIQIVLSDRPKNRDVVIDIPILEIKKLISKK